MTIPQMTEDDRRLLGMLIPMLRPAGSNPSVQVPWDLANKVLADVNRLVEVETKIRQIIESRQCTDHGCIWGHPGGMGTNGGCQALKLSGPEVSREIRAIARELREALGDAKEENQ